MLEAKNIYVGAPVCVLREGKPFCNTTIQHVQPAKERVVYDLDGNATKVSEPTIFVKGNKDQFGNALPVLLAELTPFHHPWREIKFSGGVPIKGIIA